MRVLIVFLDGVGLGPDDPETNPLAAARLPTIEALLDGRRPVLPEVHGELGGEPPGPPGERASLVGVDATLGVAGTPQSGTGHATLLTGEDAVRIFGRHHGPWVPTALRPLVARSSILARAAAAGLTVAFANAYPEELVARATEDGVADRRLGPLRSGPPLAAMGAGLLTRHTAALEAGRAVASEIVNDGWIRHLGRASLPVIGARAAGRNLAAITARHDLTLFAHYTTDHVGHRGTLDEATAAMERVDRFLGGVLESIPDDTLLLVISDHGNIEDTRRQHTTNPALGLVAGPGHRALAARLQDLRDVAPAVLSTLGVGIAR